MAVDVKVQSVGESITEGRLARWLKPDGAAVQADEMIVELETDKASQELAAPAAGILKILVKEGDSEDAVHSPLSRLPFLRDGWFKVEIDPVTPFLSDVR